jgi:hypothetical protein
MNRQLLLLIAVSLLILYWFIKFRHHIWIAHRRSQPSIAKRRRKNKSRPFPFPTKRPECPLCQAEETQDSDSYLTIFAEFGTRIGHAGETEQYIIAVEGRYHRLFG